MIGITLHIEAPELARAIEALAEAWLFSAKASVVVAKTDTPESQPPASRSVPAVRTEPAGVSRADATFPPGRGKGQERPRSTSATPAAKVRPPASSSGGGKRWTDARKAILRSDYPAGVATDTILQRLNASPGKRIVRPQVAVY